MKKNGQMKKIFIDKNEKKDIILGGKGAEYSEVSRELEQTFCDWIQFANVEECEFAQRIKNEPHHIEKNINAAGEIEINISAGGESVIVPLVYVPSEADSYGRFIVNALLLLQYIASRYENKSFKKAADEFTRKMYSENEFLRNADF